MSVPDDVPYFSRFVVKFVEIIAAGLATAVSGYLIAHLSGAFSSPAPAPAAAVIQVAPSAGIVSKGLPAQPIPPRSADVEEQHLAPQQEVNAPGVAQPARKALTTATAEPPRKRVEMTTTAAESKRDQESFVARVRAALATVDANRTDPLVPPLNDVPPRSAAIASQPAPLADSPGTVAITVAPAAAIELRQAPVQQPATEPNPLTAIETKSRPVAAPQSASTPPAAEETGVLSTLEQILRHDPLAATEEAPRPPMPVGQ